MFSFFLRSKLVRTNILQFIKFLSRTQSLFSKAKIGSCRREPSDYTMCAANQACISTHRQVVYTGQCNRRRTNALSHHICRTVPDRAKADTKPDIKNQQGKPALLTSFAHHSGQYPRVRASFSFVYLPAAKLRTRNLAPVLSHTWRDFSISSGEITSTTVIRTSGQCATHSRVNCSMASNALPP